MEVMMMMEVIIMVMNKDLAPCIEVARNNSWVVVMVAVGGSSGGGGAVGGGGRGGALGGTGGLKGRRLGWVGLW